MNKLGYILSGTAYFLLALTYVFRGRLQIGNTVFKIAHREMQLIVSILYFTLGYVYIVDGVYHQFEDVFVDEHSSKEEKEETEESKEEQKKKRMIKYLKLVGIYIVLTIIIHYYGKKLIAREEHH